MQRRRTEKNMTPEENKAVLQRFYELVEDVFRTGDVDALDEVLAPEFVFHQLVHPQRGLWAMSYSGRHETSDIRTFAFGNGARDPRSGTALQRRLRDAPMPGNPGERPRAFSPEDRPELGMRLANGQE